MGKKVVAVGKATIGFRGGINEPTHLWVRIKRDYAHGQAELFDEMVRRGVRYAIPTTARSSTVLGTLRATFDRQAPGAYAWQAKSANNVKAVYLEFPVRYASPSFIAHAQWPGPVEAWLFANGSLQIRSRKVLV